MFYKIICFFLSLPWQIKPDTFTKLTKFSKVILYMLTLRKLNEMKPEFTFLTNKLQRNWLI